MVFNYVLRGDYPSDYLKHSYLPVKYSNPLILKIHFFASWCFGVRIVQRVSSNIKLHAFLKLQLCNMIIAY